MAHWLIDCANMLLSPPSPHPHYEPRLIAIKCCNWLFVNIWNVRKITLCIMSEIEVLGSSGTRLLVLLLASWLRPLCLHSGYVTHATHPSVWVSINAHTHTKDGCVELLVSWLRPSWLHSGHVTHATHPSDKHTCCLCEQWALTHTLTQKMDMRAD